MDGVLFVNVFFCAVKSELYGAFTLSFNIVFVQCSSTSAEHIFHRKGLDCRRPTRARTFNRRDGCGLPSAAQEGEIHVGVIQKLRVLNLPAIRCVRRASILVEYCGSYSHMKLVQPPRIDQPEVMSEQECHAAAGGQVALSAGKKVLISRNSPFYTQYLQHGSTTWTTGNLFCQGADLNINGELHSSILVYRSVYILVEDVQVEFSIAGGALVDVTNRQTLNYLCRPGVACASNEAMYIYDQRPNLCPLRHVRTVEARTLMHQGQEHFLSRSHRLFLKKGAVQAVPTGCPPATVFATQYEALLVSTGRVPNLPSVGGDVDLDLEIRTSIEFTEVEAIAMAREVLQDEQRSLCLLTLQSAVTGDIPSPFSPHAILRARGDVITELSCQEVRVEFRLHEMIRPECFRGAVIGRVHEEIVLLDTQTFTVHEVSELSLVSCEDHFPALLRTEEGEHVSVHPQVAVEKVTITAMDQLKGGPLLKHVDNGQSLLYSDAEIVKYNNLLHFGRVHKLVAAQLTTNICPEGGKCGMSLGKAGPILGMSNLIPMALPDFKELLLDHLMDVGSVCGLLVFLLLAIQYLVASCRMVRSCIHCSRPAVTGSAGTVVEVHQAAAAGPGASTPPGESVELAVRPRPRPRVTFADGS